MIEIYKTIEGYEDYEVSNLGNVRSLNYRKTNKEKVLKPILCRGYEQVCLCKNKIKKMYKVHRLVAQAFIPNPNNLPQVNHKDENKANNMVWVNDDGSIDYDKSNLEWCNHSQNIRHSRGKTIIQYDSKGKILREWKNLATIEEQLNYNKSNICNVCKGIRKTAYGFIWKYKE